jgi:AraC-like DNA-binding protein
MLLYLSVTGIFLSALLLVYNARKNPSSTYLAIFFFSISTYGFIQDVILYSKSALLVATFFLNATFITYLIGPMLYLYTRSILTDNSKLRKSDSWHFLPAIIFFIISLPHLFSTWSDKIEIANKIIENNQYVVTYNANNFHGLILGLVIFLSRPVLAFCYLIWSVFLLVKFNKLRKESRILSQQMFIVKWLIVLFSFFLILIVSHTIQIVESFSIQNLVIFYITNILQFLSGIGLIGLLVSPFFFPEILYGMPRIPKSASENVSEEKKSTQSEDKKQLSEFEQDYLLAIQHKVEICMSNLQPYLQSDCNLAYFAKLVKIPAHHLAYYFREERKHTFNDYRNEWRVNHAKKLIAEGRSSELTLEAIGHLSGFSSRNAFFTAFKKVEEISPSAFAAQFIK